jgi:hypothetical protein
LVKDLETVLDKPNREVKRTGVSLKAVVPSTKPRRTTSSKEVGRITSLTDLIHPSAIYVNYNVIALHDFETQLS